LVVTFIFVYVTLKVYKHKIMEQSMRERIKMI